MNGGNFNIITTQTGCYLPNLADSIFTADRIPPSCQAKICSKMSKSDVKARDWRKINKNCNLVRWHAFWPQKAHFPPYFAYFFDRSRCYGLQKSASSGKKWSLFCLRRDHANQLQFFIIRCMGLIGLIFLCIFVVIGWVSRCLAQKSHFFGPDAIT